MGSPTRRVLAVTAKRRSAPAPGWLRSGKSGAASCEAAARRPIRGAERVAGLLIRGLRSVDFEAKPLWLNGSPAARIDIGGHLDTAASVAVENGGITRTYAIRDPHKLARLD